VAVVPEPSATLLAGCGLIAIGGGWLRGRLRRRQSAA
jgi:hypothetical protein